MTSTLQHWIPVVKAPYTVQNKGNRMLPFYLVWVNCSFNFFRFLSGYSGLCKNTKFSGTALGNFYSGIKSNGAFFLCFCSVIVYSMH